MQSPSVSSRKMWLISIPRLVTNLFMGLRYSQRNSITWHSIHYARYSAYFQNIFGLTSTEMREKTQTFGTPNSNQKYYELQNCLATSNFSTILMNVHAQHLKGPLLSDT
ncbi:hypothetical protein GcM3_01560 [Golovinomyces cichoracearum]|uniref:Uncharacterized protein n=1 Tax=Golovinomyces cichoracearum TaxID=62708 RepID=A0A420HL95_9PEZI|nr:hypothetical protein GcM3_01560 [Golovinomyces cichoracearum]